jgi:DUF1707 SHOCT-like domain
MSSPRSNRWARGPAARRASSVDPQLRVSDAERADVADRLSKHYSDGRLDQAEFNERLDRAMKAKTQSDLNGLFADLPATEDPGKQVRERSAPPPTRRPRHRIIGLVLIIVIAAVVGHALALPFFFWNPLGGLFPWLLIGLIVFLWWRSSSGRSSQR